MIATMHPRRAGAQGGFTLVEMLVASALFAMLASLLLGGLGLGVRVMEGGARRADRTAQLAAAYGFVRQQLGRAMPLYGMRDGQRGAMLFEGRQDGVEFVGIAPAYLAADAYQRISLRLENAQAGGRLVAAWRRLPRWEEKAGEPRISVLLRDVAHAEFAYFGRTAPGAAAQWVSVWPRPDALPRLLRLRLAFANGERAPDLVVALRLVDDSTGSAAR